MWPMRRWVLIQAMIALAAGSLPGQSPVDPSQWVDSIFAPYHHRSVPGCAVGVIQKGALSVARGYGEADLRHRVPNSAQSAFYVASLSKQFTAMSIVLLVQDGKLRLDDD